MYIIILISKISVRYFSCEISVRYFSCEIFLAGVWGDLIELFG
jgi:hypothetical protein